MTVATYMTQKFQSFGIELSEADLLDLCLSLDGDAEVGPDNMRDVQLELRRFIPQLLAHPARISEGGMSLSWDKDALISYYGFLCKSLGLPEELGSTPSVTFVNLRRV